MANVLDYIRWRGDLSFQASPFNEVDNLILCCLSYIRYQGAADFAAGQAITLRQASSWLESLPEEARHTRSALDPELLSLAGASRRFGQVRLTHYEDIQDPEQELQFSAVTFLLDEDKAYVAFRGTDNTLVGWKEDFNMSYLPQVPAQREAVRYLDALRSLPQKELLVGGHSKGGNLAVYAAVQCLPMVQRRIRSVYSNDGPGFFPSLLDTPQYERLKDRILCLIPQSSIVGLMLEHRSKVQVVHSAESGFYQHDPYTWQVLGAALVPEDGVDASSLVIDQSLKSWLESMTPAERESFIGEVYSAFRATNVETVREFSADLAKNSAELLRAFHGKAPETRRFMIDSVKKLLAAFHSALAVQLKSLGSEKRAGLEEKVRRMEEWLRRAEESEKE